MVHRRGGQDTSGCEQVRAGNFIPRQQPPEHEGRLCGITRIADGYDAVLEQRPDECEEGLAVKCGERAALFIRKRVEGVRVHVHEPLRRSATRTGPMCRNGRAESHISGHHSGTSEWRSDHFAAAESNA